MPLKVLFEDSEILVIDKSPGIVVTPSSTNEEETISEILIKDYKINLDRGGIVHRLDKDTSGVLIAAKTQEALDNLLSQFKERQVKKIYKALVHGFFRGEKTVKGAIARNPGNREKFIVWDEEGKEAETLFSPENFLQMSDEKLENIFSGFSKIQFRKLKNSKYQDFTLLKCFPATGRTHQIRVHLKYLGFPIAGDEKYSGRKTSRLDRRWCPRQFLHAWKLEINHPKGDRMIFESELPQDLFQVLEKLEKAD